MLENDLKFYELSINITKQTTELNGIMFLDREAESRDLRSGSHGAQADSLMSFARFLGSVRK